MGPEHACAQLLEDAGAAAEGEDFFRGRHFFDAENVSHTLVIESSGDRVEMPVLVRATPNGAHLDAISPYGYPGAALATASESPRIDPAKVDWSATGLVSAFIRDRLGHSPCLVGATQRSVVQVSDPELPRKSRMSDRQQMRRNEAAGYEIDFRPGPEATDGELSALAHVYRQTMERAGASERYMYGQEWFAAVLGSPRSWLFLVRSADGEVAAAALAVESDGIVHYYLSGTAEVAHRDSPSKNLIVAVTEFAEERGALMNLGGGMVPGDSLEEFKKGFANRELPFHTHELVCDPGVYSELTVEHSKGDFFPLYRAPAG
jgi:hypothetical protein